MSVFLPHVAAVCELYFVARAKDVPVWHAGSQLRELRKGLELSKAYWQQCGAANNSPWLCQALLSNESRFAALPPP